MAYDSNPLDLTIKLISDTSTENRPPIPRVIMQIVLNEEDFRCLVSGGILTITREASNEREEQTVRMFLSDIGFHRMAAAIDDAYEGHLKTYSNRERTT